MKSLTGEKIKIGNGSFYKTSGFAGIAHWLTKKEIPTPYKSKAVQIAHNLYGKAWAILYFSTLCGEVEVLEWNDIPEIYRRYELRPKV